jgi:hypothetical protein
MSTERKVPNSCFCRLGLKIPNCVNANPLELRKALAIVSELQ